MDLQTSKTLLIEWLSNLEDGATIQKFVALMEDSTARVSSEEKASVDAGLSDADNGNLAPQTAAEKSMENGCDIFWTSHALRELTDTYAYLENHFSPAALSELSHNLDRILKLIAKNPSTFPKSDFKGVRKVVIKKFNTLYYRVVNNRIEIISFFSNRQNPEALGQIFKNKE